MVVTSYGCNKNRDDEIKNQEKANNRTSYRCAAINYLKLKTPKNIKLLSISKTIQLVFAEVHVDQKTVKAQYYI